MHKQETDSVPLHNKFSETVFAVYDRLITVKPVIKFLAAEATVMFCLNKTAEYLKTKSEVEINVIMERAKKDTKHYQEEMRKRHVEITRRKKENLEKKMKKEAELEAYREKVTLEITKGIIRHGLFQTENEVDVKMKLLKSKEERCEALIANLKFRKNILKQKTEQKELLNLTKNKKKKTWQELATDLRKLIKESNQNVNNTEENPGSLLIGKIIFHNIGHRYKEGVVISQVPGFSDWFNIKYENSQIIYTKKLYADYLNKKVLFSPPEAEDE